MRAALSTSPSAPGARRRLAVLGDMAELGADAAAYHREVGALVRELGVDELIARRRARTRLRRRAGSRRADRDGRRSAACGARRPGDVVLVKGSRAVGLEVVAANLDG